MKDPLKISIITVCLNAEKTIFSAIESVLSQTYLGVEFIIKDGGSTDKTLEIIRQYKAPIIHLISGKDAGLYDAMNKGLSLATGDIVYFLNADDQLYDNDVLKDICHEFEIAPDTEIIYGQVKLENVPAGLADRVDHENAMALQNPVSLKRNLLRFGVCHQGIFARRAVFDKVGPFDLYLKIVADFAWFMRALQMNTNIHCIDRYVCRYHFQGFSHQRLPQRKQERMRVIHKNTAPGEFLIFILDKLIDRVGYVFHRLTKAR